MALVLNRNVGDAFIIEVEPGVLVTVAVIRIVSASRNPTIHIGITAPRRISVDRAEIRELKRAGVPPPRDKFGDVNGNRKA